MIKKINYFLLTKSLGLYLNLLVYLFPAKAQKKAYDLFSTPRKGKINQLKVPKFIQAHRSERLNYQNHTFQTYTWSGNSEIILLLHGWESNSNRWKKTLPHLLKLGKTIIAIDAPAHGLSSGKEFNVPLYVEFVKVLVQKYQPKIIVGHSVGGMAAMYYQYKYPDSNLQKMILLE